MLGVLVLVLVFVVPKALLPGQSVMHGMSSARENAKWVGRDP